MEKHKVVIIGSGPSGHTAALYAARANLSPLVIEGHEPGGQLTLTTVIENFPGFPEGILGSELVGQMKKQAIHFGATYMAAKVTDITTTERPFHIKTENGLEFLAETLIIATGASAKLLGLPEEKSLIGRGVSTCATCDGFFYRDRVIHIVGGGDSALEEAHFLTKFASHVYLLHRRDQLRGSKIMQDRILKHPKITVLWNSVVDSLLSDQAGLTGLMVRNTKDGSLQKRETDGLFYAIGHNPNTEFLKGALELDSHGFIKTKNQVETSVEGIFACGDVQDPYYRQAITAAGSGCQAALRAERLLEAEAIQG